LLLAKQIITLYHAVQKTLTKDQHALARSGYIFENKLHKLKSPNTLLTRKKKVILGLFLLVPYLKIKEPVN
ncbi:hypothetical protein, partial [Vibrio tasmaniensis]|uniref:hypothetical protein n=1 Tax=Vibrio tasmaniensis TaxID=212663 RepID=UPI00107F876C